jgi:Tfp pilus assembly protein PilX
MSTKMIQSGRQSGAVSLFVVIFAALLMTVVTVGFIQLMVKDQQQATATDLSQSAYDSAQAGVEDAKRLLLALQACGESTDAKCQQYRQAVADGKCSTLSDAALVGTANGETIIEQHSGDAALDQAYTCVKIALNTENYRRPLLRNTSLVVPLTSEGEFHQVEISWFTSDDAGGNTVALNGPGVVGLPLSPVGNKWPNNMPTLLRAQLIQTGESFQYSDFDDTTSSKSNANTLFLYPSAIASKTGDFLLNAARRSPTTAPIPAHCEPNFTSSIKYACSMTLSLPAPKNGSLQNRGAYLRLSSLYNDTNFQLRLRNSVTGDYVDFKAVQPKVDSTGRANDLFRRVEARVELTGSMPYPEAAVDIEGNLCKNFLITDNPNDYVNTCTP